jgi:hypothetical protein
MTNRESRERFIELFSPFADSTHFGGGTIVDGTKVEDVVDHLIAEGVIVPPCKVGDTVYSLREVSCEDIDGAHTECEYYGFGTDDRICTLNKPQKCPHKYRIFKCLVTEYNLLSFARQWGKTVFLTKEEAEAKLKEMKNNESH